MLLSDNKPIKFWGKKPNFKFPVKDHIELGEIHDLFEFDVGAKIAGARFFYLKNEAVILAWALQNFAMEYLRQSGFGMVWPPVMMNRAALAGGVNIEEFKDTIYKIEGEDLYLIGTSEHPLVALKKDQVLTEDQLPIRLGGISPCFRKEAGSHGKDTRGIFRVHQFNKIEQFVFSRPEDSWAEHEKLIKNAEYLFQQLEIPHRVVNICTGDLGGTAAKKYDLEAWMPVQDTYREMVSCSNCTDYQARKLNIR